MKNRKLIVTGGPTREWLDPVRFISNPSTGKMGAALAEAGVLRCAETVFIHGAIDANLYKNKPYREVAVDTTQEMLSAVKSELVSGSLLIMAAAPADYTPVSVSPVKIKKEEGEMQLLLKKTPDILKNIAASIKNGEFNNIFTVGFAVETNNPEEYAISKLKDKNLDMICLNDVSQSGAGFAVDTNIIVIYNNDGSKLQLPLLSKQDTAERIFDSIEEQMKKLP
ncbi:MAG: phosphopantothenoylcysteine decarboxylase [Leptospirales bacterium]|nr:phosphopantothenoylcysteine decarboxylase [Leptospirales bacterium]